MAYTRKDKILATRWGDRILTYKQGDKVITYMRGDEIMANQWEDKILAYKREVDIMATRWEDEIVITMWRKNMANQKSYPSMLPKTMLPRTMFLGTTSLLTRVTYQMTWTVTTHTLMRGVFLRLQRRGMPISHWTEKCPRNYLREQL